MLEEVQELQEDKVRTQREDAVALYLQGTIYKQRDFIVTEERAVEALEKQAVEARSVVSQKKTQLRRVCEWLNDNVGVRTGTDYLAEVGIFDSEGAESEGVPTGSLKLPKIYLWVEDNLNDNQNSVVGYALSEDGELLAQHTSSNTTFFQQDIGFTSKSKHDIYDKKYPGGYELLWVEDRNSNEDWKKSLDLYFESKNRGSDATR